MNNEWPIDQVTAPLHDTQITRGARGARTNMSHWYYCTYHVPTHHRVYSTRRGNTSCAVLRCSRHRGAWGSFLPPRINSSSHPRPHRAPSHRPSASHGPWRAPPHAHATRATRPQNQWDHGLHGRTPGDRHGYGAPHSSLALG